MKIRFLLASAAAVTGTIASAQQATYWMTAETATGLSQMALGGRGAGQAHNLRLHLGASKTAPAEAVAEHLPPSGLGAGDTLPLLLVKRQGSRPEEPFRWKDADMKGKILIYWGCGNAVRAGQPSVIDFSKFKGQGSKVFPASILQFAMPTMPSAERHASYAHWPNEKARRTVPAQGSLVGDHVVRSAYTPEIRFSLNKNQDFLSPVVLKGGTAPGADGSIQLAWNPVGNAKAYFAMAMGQSEAGEMVFWSSSELPAMGSPDFLEASEISRLLQKKALLGSSQTQCAIPSAVAERLSGAMLSVTAFGPEANFSHPVRPANAKANWRPDWTTRLLTKASYMGVLGMDDMFGGNDDGGEMTDMSETGEETQAETPAKAKKGLLKKGIGGLFKKAL